MTLYHFAAIEYYYQSPEEENHEKTHHQFILTRQYLRAPIFGISLRNAINNFKQKETDNMNLDVSEGGF